MAGLLNSLAQAATPQDWSAFSIDLGFAILVFLAVLLVFSHCARVRARENKKAALRRMSDLTSRGA